MIFSTYRKVKTVDDASTTKNVVFFFMKNVLQKCIALCNGGATNQGILLFETLKSISNSKSLIYFKIQT